MNLHFIILTFRVRFCNWNEYDQAIFENIQLICVGTNNFKFSFSSVPVINILLLILNQMTVCNVKVCIHTDGPTENYHQLFRVFQFTAQVLQHIWWLSQSLCSHQACCCFQQKSCKKPLSATCSAAKSRQTQLQTSW